MNGSDPATTRGIPKMMIAFVVRRCTIDLGHFPDAAEFAAWANHQGTPRDRWCLFGRPISEFEAGVILRHRARLVSAKSATAVEQYVEDEATSSPSNVIVLDTARARTRSAAKGPTASRLKS